MANYIKIIRKIADDDQLVMFEEATSYFEQCFNYITTKLGPRENEEEQELIEAITDNFSADFAGYLFSKLDSTEPLKCKIRLDMKSEKLKKKYLNLLNYTFIEFIEAILSFGEGEEISHNDINIAIKMTPSISYFFSEMVDNNFYNIDAQGIISDGILFISPKFMVLYSKFNDRLKESEREYRDQVYSILNYNKREISKDGLYTAFCAWIKKQNFKMIDIAAFAMHLIKRNNLKNVFNLFKKEKSQEELRIAFGYTGKYLLDQDGYVLIKLL